MNEKSEENIFKNALFHCASRLAMRIMRAGYRNKVKNSRKVPFDRIIPLNENICGKFHNKNFAFDFRCGRYTNRTV